MALAIRKFKLVTYRDEEDLQIPTVAWKNQAMLNHHMMQVVDVDKKTWPGVSQVILNRHMMQNVAVDDHILFNPELQLASIARDPRGFMLVPEQLRNDPHFILQVLNGCGALLQYMSEAVRADRRFVTAAVRQDGLALRSASEELQGDPDVCSIAVQQNGLALKHCGWKTHDITILAVNQNGMALRHADEECRRDLHVALLAITSSPKAMRYVHWSLLDDPTVREVLWSHDLHCALCEEDVERALAAIEFGGEYHYKDYGGLVDAAANGRIALFTKVQCAKPIDIFGLKLCAEIARSRKHVSLATSLNRLAEDCLRKKDFTRPAPLKEVDFDRDKMLQESRDRLASVLANPRNPQRPPMSARSARSGRGGAASERAEEHSPVSHRTSDQSTKTINIKSRVDMYMSAKQKRSLLWFRKNPQDAAVPRASKLSFLKNFVAASGKTGMLSMFAAAGVALDTVDDNGWTPAHWAASKGKAATLRKLGELGASMGERSDLPSERQTPMHLAAGLGHLEALDELAVWAPVDVADFFDRLPIHLAAANGHSACVRLLIEVQGRIDLTDGEGRTPIHTAALAGHVDALDLLLEAADEQTIAIPDGQGCTALDYVQQIDPPFCIKRLGLIAAFERVGAIEPSKDYLGQKAHRAMTGIKSFAG